MLGILKGNSGNGFLKQTCGTYLFSAVRHILRTSAAERLAATRQSRQLFTGLQQFHSPTQSLHRNKFFGPQLRDQPLEPSASLHMTSFFCSCNDGVQY